MLSDEDKARIRAEEEYRAAARAEAERAAPAGSRRGVAGLLLSALVAGVLSYLAFGALRGALRPAPAAPGGEAGNPFGLGRGTVRYAVTFEPSDPQAGCAADVTVSAGVGETRRYEGVASGWERVVEARAGEFLYLAAQLRCRGRVEVAIYRNGRLLEEGEAVGERAAAEVSSTY